LTKPITEAKRESRFYHVCELFHTDLTASSIQSKFYDNTENKNVCSIQQQHAVITSKKGEVEIEPASQGAKIKVNGMPLTGKISLNHLDRVLFGECSRVYLC
jgi:hypothetical protein